MKDLKMPYFFINKKWYYYDEKEEKYKLTDKAPKKAVESYEEFYSTKDNNLDSKTLDLSKNKN